MKKFVDDPALFVHDMFEGIYLANQDTLEWVPEYNILYRKNMPQDKVLIMQGSGSGHEPAHSMIVGQGMLDACCPGNVFAAPPMDYVLECTKILARTPNKGILHLINNYTGDRMAWDMGKEMAEAELPDQEIGVVIVNDDVAVQDSLYTVGRRGVAGNFFVIKACAAAAEQGKSLAEVVAVGEKVNGWIRSMGIALSSCTPPAKGTPIFEIGDDEIEVGVGIHGEPGRRRDKIRPASDIMDEVFTAVANDLPYEAGDRVAVMINGLGGTPISELYLLYGLAAKRCAERGLVIAKNYVGEYCTSLEMQGFSLTLCKLDEEIEGYLNAPAAIPIRVF
ncbi:MAG: dihydroxyacetone kinase subunit DhaK [Propionibacteriaceae bacterium]|jgi:dihydroxyacetone kinase-like protein|nr:dihydroxyacetone kinase subunit DhaK [Propionibacteriaceae bacterium]